MPSLVEIGPLVLDKKMKMWKVYRQTDRQRDRQTDRKTDGQIVIRKAHLSFQLRLAKGDDNCRTIQFDKRKLFLPNSIFYKLTFDFKDKYIFSILKGTPKAFRRWNFIFL